MTRPTKKKAPAKKKTTTTRPSKFTLRLERGEGDARLFWEIKRSKSTLTTHFGRHLSAGRTIVKEHDSIAAAEKAYVKAIAEKRDEGYTEPAPKDVVGSSGRSGVAASNPELEALIEEDPSDLQRYLIYADWLQQQSDPRGELIVAQHGIATTPSDQSHQIDTLENIEQELLKKFSAELLGDVLVKYTRLRTSKNSYRGLAWRCGFIRAARLVPLHGRGQEAEEAIEALLKHPSARFLEHIAVGPHNLPSVCAVLVRGPQRATLRSIAIGTLYPTDEPLTPLWSALPNLRHLKVTSGVTTVGVDQVSDLETLFIGWGDPISLASFGKTTFPRVTHLHITVASIDESTINASLTALIDHMPALKHWTVRRWLVDEMGRPAPQDDLARIAIAIALRQKVETLDLQMALSNGYAESLSTIKTELSLLKSLRLPAEGVGNKLIRAGLSTDLRHLKWTESPEERSIEDVESFHHEALLPAT